MSQHAFDASSSSPAKSRGGRSSYLLPGLIILLLLTAVLFRSESSDIGPLAATPIAWQTSPSAGNEKPTLYYFTASWCPPCQAMKKEVWPTQLVADAAAPYTPVMIDVDADPVTAGQFGIASIPTVIALSPEGQVLGRFEGYRDARETATFLAAHAK